MTVRRVLALAAAVAAAAAHPAAGATPRDVFYERAVMSAAGERCGLFEPSVGAALTAGARQARGAALRAGVDVRTLDALAARARARGDAARCDDPGLRGAAQKVVAAFAGYSRMSGIVYPGALGEWRAERSLTGWRLSQSARTGPGPATFGLAETRSGRDALVFVAAWPKALAASGARLVVRDTDKAPEPYIDPRVRGLAGRTAPRAVSRAFLASGRSVASPELTPTGASTAVAFRFPAAAAQAMDELDPREAVVVELVYPARGGDQVEQVAFEVGDFAAGRAFLAAGR